MVPFPNCNHTEGFVTESFQSCFVDVEQEWVHFRAKMSDGWWSENNSFRYMGPLFCSALQASRRILKRMQSLMGSQ